ncbi:MAG: DEAD/DEAH box helicase, partial [Desulfobacterales bacterium]|nr:DEAD/DEAH box helicase [Desulfobacterales bacterium]
MKTSFSAFFKSAMGRESEPYPYQTRLALQPWPDIITTPTGMGKTAAVILAWLFKRLENRANAPRRLVYCLPMRVLVEQTARNAEGWVDALVKSGVIPRGRAPSVNVLMGGEIDMAWDRFPERDAILVGTQDQLLSRALNRGYGMSRYRWPVHYALLNNDCLWVMDEVQLMGSGLATTTQLQAFRSILGCAAPVRSIWMSATLERRRLNTIDFADQFRGLVKLELSPDDIRRPEVFKRISAEKPLVKSNAPADKPNRIAEQILAAHRKGTRTLVVVNTVKRAVDVYKALVRKKSGVALTLIHSRFRPPDR